MAGLVPAISERPPSGGLFDFYSQSTEPKVRFFQEWKSGASQHILTLPASERVMQKTMRAFLTVISIDVTTALGQEAPWEVFLFQSAEKEGALTIDASGAKLPHRPGGWKNIGSLGHYDALDDDQKQQLRTRGYVTLEKPQAPSTRVEDWRAFPAGTFGLTERALAEARRIHAALSESGAEPCVVSFTWGPVSVKDKDSITWRHLGQRLTIGGFPAANVPAAAVDDVGGVPIIFLFDAGSLPSPRPEKIDYTEEGFVFGK